MSFVDIVSLSSEVRENTLLAPPIHISAPQHPLAPNKTSHSTTRLAIFEQTAESVLWKDMNWPSFNIRRNFFRSRLSAVQKSGAFEGVLGRSDSDEDGDANRFGTYGKYERILRGQR